MKNDERASHYAALFTAVGDRWRYCVPIDGAPHKAEDRMQIDGIVIAKTEGSDRWRQVPS